MAGEFRRHDVCTHIPTAIGGERNAVSVIAAEFKLDCNTDVHIVMRGEGLVELLERCAETVTLSGAVVEDASDFVATGLGQRLH